MLSANYIDGSLCGVVWHRHSPGEHSRSHMFGQRFLKIGQWLSRDGISDEFKKGLKVKALEKIESSIGQF